MQPSYYAVIPAKVRYDTELPANAKLLYGEITALCSKEGYCWATNKYFGDLYDVHEKTVSLWISLLAERGHLRTEVADNYSRKIYIEEGGTVISSRGCQEKLTGVPQKADNSITSITTNNTGSVEIGISPSLSPENNDDTPGDSMDYEEETTVVECDEEGNPLTYNGFAKRKPKSAPKQPHKHDALLKRIEKVYNKRFTMLPKQYKAMNAIFELEFTKEDIQDAIDRLIEKPFYKENGWDMMSVLSELGRK